VLMIVCLFRVPATTELGIVAKNNPMVGGLRGEGGRSVEPTDPIASLAMTATEDGLSEDGDDEFGYAKGGSVVSGGAGSATQGSYVDPGDDYDDDEELFMPSLTETASLATRGGPLSKDTTKSLLQEHRELKAKEAAKNAPPVKHSSKRTKAAMDIASQMLGTRARRK
jgi:hypothetical protein